MQEIHYLTISSRVKDLHMRNILILAFLLHAYWTVCAQESQLTAFDGSFADLYGFAVAIDGDYAVVGAPLQGDFGTNNAGAAYVYQNMAGSWTYVKKLVPPWGGMPGDQFGYSVGIEVNQIIIGAPSTDHYNLADVGSAYVFRGTGTTWTQEAHLFPTDGAAGDRFANAVDISGDHAVVGSAGDDDHGSASGSVYIFGYHNYNWSFEEKIHSSDAATGDVFGTDVSIDGTNVLVGAPGNIGANDKHSGAIYIFHPYTGGWHQAARLTHNNPDFFDHFGESVDIEGDYLIAGAPFANDKAGEAYIFTGSGYNWSQAAQLTASEGAPHDKFGISVGITNGYAAIGAHLDDDLGTESGSMYIFVQSGNLWNETDKHTASDGNAYDKFGQSVDIDGDHAIAGAQNQDVVATDAGAAYIYGPAAAPTCDPSMYLSGTIIGGTYLTSDHIQLDGIIMQPSSVTVGAPNFVELMPSFGVAQGATFVIRMDGCTE